LFELAQSIEKAFQFPPGNDGGSKASTGATVLWKVCQNQMCPQDQRSIFSESHFDENPGIRWKPLLAQMLFLTTVEHALRMTAERTRRQLDGPFFRDWKESVTGLRGWKDGGKFFTNYVAHPGQGAAAGFIYKNNDTRYRAITFDAEDGQYWKMTGHALVFAAAHSALFELGPFSEASLGNVGQERYLSYSRMAWVDLVVTPTVGTAWMVGEDVLDKHFIQWIERRTDHKSAYLAARTFLNPVRSFTNLLRFKAPFYRNDRR
jgi:hypothetical protein